MKSDKSLGWPGYEAMPALYCVDSVGPKLPKLDLRLG